MERRPKTVPLEQNPRGNRRHPRQTYSEDFRRSTLAGSTRQVSEFDPRGVVVAVVAHVAAFTVEAPQRFADFESGVRAIYTTVCDTVSDDTAVLQALFAEVLAKPNGIGSQLFRDRILPRITSTVGAWLQEQIRAGHCVDVPLSLLIPLLISPISVHLLARNRLIAAGAAVPDRHTVIEVMTTTFCNAVGTTSRHETSAS